jgi:hypothetical protein
MFRQSADTARRHLREPHVIDQTVSAVLHAPKGAVFGNLSRVETFRKDLLAEPREGGAPVEGVQIPVLGEAKGPAVSGYLRMR